MFIARAHRLNKHVFRTQLHHLVIILYPIHAVENNSHGLLRCCKYLKLYLTVSHLLNVQHKVFRGLLDNANLTIGHEILHELLLLVRHEPCEVGLILSIDTSHQFDIGAETCIGDSDVRTIGLTDFISEVAVPCTTEIAVTPCPLLLAWREVVRSDMQHTAFGIVLVAALKVVLRIDSHIACRHVDIFIVRNIDTSRIVHLIICSRSYGERRHGTFTMVEHGVNIRWEDTLVCIVYLDGRICPPKERLW